LSSNSIKDKWDANCWKIYPKSSCEYGVEKEKLLQNINMKRHLSIPFHFGMGYINSMCPTTYGT
jgi:hypothetical protein